MKRISTILIFLTWCIVMYANHTESKGLAKAALAEIDGQLFQLLQKSDARAMLRVILINEYLTNQPTKTMPNITQLIMTLPLKMP